MHTAGVVTWPAKVDTAFVKALMKRMTQLPVSATYKFPDESNATPLGPWKHAFVPVASVKNAVHPVALQPQPAIVVTVYGDEVVIRLIALLSLSAM